MRGCKEPISEWEAVFVGDAGKSVLSDLDNSPQEGQGIAIQVAVCYNNCQ